jgi:hypothetical protein
VGLKKKSTNVDHFGKKLTRPKKSCDEAIDCQYKIDGVDRVAEKTERKK